MADGDVRLDDEYEFPDGSRVVLYAVESGKYPGGFNPRFASVDPATGENSPRSDISRTPRHGVGVHHRHRGATISRLTYEGFGAHPEKFWRAVRRKRAEREGLPGNR